MFGWHHAAIPDRRRYRVAGGCYFFTVNLSLRPMLHVSHGNRLERLAAALVDLVAVPAACPFAAETIIVQSAGMSRWLSLWLADHLGVCANVRFPLPAGFLWSVFRAVLPGVPETSEYDPGVLTWRVLQVLMGLDASPQFAPLRAYIEGGDDTQSYELAARVAETFDQYLVYRPDWIKTWEAGGHEHWQAELWRRLAKSSRGSHWVNVRDQLVRALADDRIDWTLLPRRVFLFGIPSLSPAYLDLLVRLAGGMQIHVFQLNPSRQYWGEIISARDLSRKPSGAAGRLYFEAGNALLASLGKQGRDFIGMLQGYEAVEHDLFEGVDTSTLLGHLQADILDLIERGPPEYPAVEVLPGDRSVQVHVCHGPMRELEVLRDQLLRCFERLPGLRPSDVIVMTPGIEDYAPYVEAVFGAAQGKLHIPYSIADRGYRSTSSLIETWFRLLELPPSRYGAEAIAALLECPAVWRRFGLGVSDLPLVHRWIRESGIRWGIDGRHRAELGLPAHGENTWRAGLDRLTLGYALPAGSDALFADILPYDDVEGGDAELLGRLLSFCEEVFALRERLGRPLPVARWVEVLTAILDRFFDPTDLEEADAATIRRVLEALDDTVELAGFDGSASLELMRAYLQRTLDAPGPAGPFLNGRVSFSAMIPMRSLPFRVVCLVGMNDGSYPRYSRKLGFDLMSNDFRTGDRSRRDDDRYLFLEAILSARDCLYLSYVGQDVRDNGELPPSVLVAELLDHIDRGFWLADGAPARGAVVVHHPLQPFSHRYFTDDEKLVSYGQDLCAAVRGRSTAIREPQPLFTSDLPEAQSELLSLSIDGLTRFFANPTRYLLRQRLGLYLGQAEDELITEEPFALGYPTKRDLRDRLLSLRLDKRSPREAFPSLRAEGLLPHGRVGEVCFGRELDVAEAFAGRVMTYRPPQAWEPQWVDLPVGSMRLSGWLSGLSPVGQIGYRLGEVSARDLLALWLRHLILNAEPPTGVEPRSRWIGEDRVVALPPIGDAGARLQALLDLYWAGLHRPLHFFPKSAHAYVTTERKGRSDPLLAARRAWRGSDFSRGEREDPYYLTAYRTIDPLDRAFIDSARAVFDPILEVLEEIC